jgi:hypothetical protein
MLQATALQADERKVNMSSILAMAGWIYLADRTALVWNRTST